jgi:uncharacterized protein YlzI (FlbEa/FlbD family)
MLALLMVAWHLVLFTGIDGNIIPLNPIAVIAVRVSPPGYAKGTMIVTGGGSFIVKESVTDVVRSLECECNLRTRK